MTGPDPNEVSRPLLGGGERLQGASQRTAGGRPPTHPRTVEEAVELLRPQVAALSEAVASTPPDLRGARMVFEAKVLPNYLANSHFPKELFREADLVPVGSRSSTGVLRQPQTVTEDALTKTYLLAGDERSISKLAALLDRSDAKGGLGAARARLRQFELLELPDPAALVRTRLAEDVGDRITWEAVLHPSVNVAGESTAREREDVFAKWVEWVTALGGEVAQGYRRLVGDLTFVPVLIAPKAAEQAARFNPLRALRPMPKVRPVPVGPLRIADAGAELPPPPAARRPRSDVRVAVFDGGTAADHPLLAPFVDAIDVTGEPEDAESVAHGTMVAGAVLYGPMHRGESLDVPEVGVDSFRVLPVPGADPFDLDLYWILDRIEQLVVERGYSIVNLSLGPELSVDDDAEPHAWTARLDAIARDHGVLFVTAAGNNGELDEVTGLNRVQVPADMVNGLAVGACDLRSPEHPWDRAPYSAVGPGRPGGRIKPCGVAFGGVAANPFLGVGVAQRLAQAAGTSFAAPTTTHGLAGLLARLGEDASAPEVLRAFAIHFAEPGDGDEAANTTGAGRFLERYDERWQCAPNEVSVLYRSTIERDETISLPLPLPPDLISRGMVGLRWTLVLTSPVDPSDAAEYTQAGLEVAFRPDERRRSFYNRETEETVTLHTVKQEEQVRERLRAGFVPSSLPVTKSGARYRNEALHEALRRDVGKWETSMSFSTSMRASGLFRPQLTVSYLAREGGGLVTADPLSFAMLVTLQAPRKVKLYDAVRQHYPVLVPLRAQIPLRVSTTGE